MKKSDLISIIINIINEEFEKAPKFGDIHPTDQKTGERPGMIRRDKDGMDITQHKKMLWAEDKDLPAQSNISDVKMPFKIVDFPDLDIMGDCTVGFYNDHLTDDRKIKHEKTEIDLNDPILYATQAHLFLKKDELQKNFEKRKNKLPIVVGFTNGVKLIQDGHHRLSIQKLNGQEKALVDLYIILDITEVEEETEDFINSLGPTIKEMNVVGGGGVSATSGGSAFGSQKKNHETLWQEEKLGKRGENGPTLFQIGSSLPDNLYNSKNGKPSRDPGVLGLKEEIGAGQIIIACRSGNTHSFNPAQQGSLGPGYYFTTNPERAKKYGGGSIVWVKIKLKNPIIGNKKDIVQNFGINDHIDIDTGAYDFKIGEEFNKEVRKQGYDGIIAQETNGKTYEIVVFDRSSFEPIKTPESV